MKYVEMSKNDPKATQGLVHRQIKIRFSLVNYPRVETQNCEPSTLSSSHIYKKICDWHN